MDAEKGGNSHSSCTIPRLLRKTLNPFENGYYRGAAMGGNRPNSCKIPHLLRKQLKPFKYGI